ncbi:MAG: ammonium transporter [Sulfitobacter sp.]
MSEIDTIWVLFATALVFLMTMPGLALFYGGMVRARNVVSVIMQCYAVACLTAVLWYVAGYSIAYGDTSPYWGGIGKVFLTGVSIDSLVGTLPETLFFAFQMTFAIITPVIIIGSCVERTKFGFILLFSGLWMLLVYAPVTHWVWGGGILSDGGLFGDIGVKDYAGGLVVHQTAGITGLILALVIGPRAVRKNGMHNPGMVMMGAAMLWVGWLGFTGGSELAVNPRTALTITVTLLAAASASLTWLLWEFVKFRKFTLVGMVTGTLSGLAAISPAAGYVGPEFAVLIGVVAGIMCQEAVYLLRDKFGIDDSLDVFAVHGVGGMYGSLMIVALGVAPPMAQLGGMAIVAGYTIVVSLILVFFCKGVTGTRVNGQTEEQGLDAVVHNQPGYDLTS